MKIFRDLDKIPHKYKGAVITLGNFDGLHLGHRKIIEQAKKIAKDKVLPLAVMTFEPHPKEFFNKEKKKIRIHSLRQKLLVMKSLGVECIFLMRFNKKLTDLSPFDFIEDILVKKLHARYVITGENFCFGRNRQGDKNLLQYESVKFNFGYQAIEHVEDGVGNIVSSSGIRQFLAGGDIKKASKLLGHPYTIIGHVKRGEGRGGIIGFPTANISFGRLFIPRHGVYAVRVTIEGKDKIYNAIANIGTKPTFGINEPLLEVHLFDLNEDLYGKILQVEFLEFIRDEQKFLSVDELKKQILTDCEKAKESHHLCYIPALDNIHTKRV